MRGTDLIFKVLTGMTLVVALLAGGCDSDDVTGPVEARNAPPVDSSTNNSTWNITVTTDPTEFDLNLGSGLAQVVVSARRADNGQVVPSGTTALLTTTHGTLTNSTGTAGQSVPITFDDGGQARATLLTGVLTVSTTIVVRSQIQSSFGTARIQMIDVDTGPFQLTSVSPSVGPPSGGVTMSLNGTGFLSPAQVTFSGSFGTVLATNVNVASSSLITATLPAINLPPGTNAEATITVENGPDSSGNPTGTDSLAGAFTYTRSGSTTTLKVISISPTSGPNEGGTQVTIRGEGFGSEAQVYFTNGPLVEATVLSISSTEIRVVTPAATGPNNTNANSLVSVIVRDPDSGQTSTLASAFQYGGLGNSMFISAVGPNQVEYTGGVSVTIFGQGFDEPVAVEAGGVGQQVLSVSGTEILFRAVPVTLSGCSSSSDAVSVVNIESGQSASGPGFTYLPVEPIIVGLSPNFDNGSGLVTITGVARRFGVGFDPPLQVKINGVVAQITAQTGDSITVEVPTFTGTYDADPTCAAAGALVDTAVDVEVINLNTGCNDTLPLSFTYPAPTDRLCENIPVGTGGGGGGGGGAGVATPATFTWAANPDGNAATFDVAFTHAPGGSFPAVQSYTWNFGDGDILGPGVFPSPDHLYAVPSTAYTVSLQVTNIQGVIRTFTDNAVNAQDQ